MADCADHYGDFRVAVYTADRYRQVTVRGWRRSSQFDRRSIRPRWAARRLAQQGLVPTESDWHVRGYLALFAGRSDVRGYRCSHHAILLFSGDDAAGIQDGVFQLFDSSKSLAP